MVSAGSTGRCFGLSAVVRCREYEGLQWAVNDTDDINSKVSKGALNGRSQQRPPYSQQFGVYKVVHICLKDRASYSNG